MRRGERRKLANRRYRTSELILAELRHWRRGDNARICEALWQLPARQPRKETDQ
ncbi:hypothetical protein ACFWFX_16075 [Streptomyces roseolus]|uniref:hypothetical protein n=1 Tax=Streptomyces roseolus TaxID=67358 RepID=UPI003659481F